MESEGAEADQERQRGKRSVSTVYTSCMYVSTYVHTVVCMCTVRV